MPCFQRGETGTTLAITDREVVPLGTDHERAMNDLVEELLRPPEVRRRVRRKVFDSEAEPASTPHATGTEYLNSREKG